MEPESNLTPGKKSKSGAMPETVGISNVVGLHTPFESSAELPAGVDEETRLFHGVDPETKERLTVTFEGLAAEFGPEVGAKKYAEIAGIGGGSVFFNPKFEATNYHPPLGISGLTGEHAAKVATILSTKE